MNKLNLSLKFEGDNYETAMRKLVDHPLLDKDHPGLVMLSYASVNVVSKRAVVTISADLSDTQTSLILKVLGLHS